ncbi:rust resistance kinase Lr10-like isoform X1 [Iris pallida]|uniref:Rust resistance kinase Lr10-like isoform X1 n=1 Tax=Iris pallida TaxID=29817 RepID=A0AAX6IK29_IRIPA|nr:rust resistance kinase Lr10-like isoform X1 [Iris pallida]
MSVLFFFLLLLQSTTRPALSKPDPQEQFFADCPPASCGSGLQIRFPLRLRSSPPSCGLEGLELSCRGNDTLLSLPTSPVPLRVSAVNYRLCLLTVDAGTGSLCPIRNLSSLATSVYTPQSLRDYSLVACRNEIEPGPDVAAPVSCPAGDADGATYAAVYSYGGMDLVPSHCTMVSARGDVPAVLDWDYAPEYRHYGFREMAEAFVRTREVSLSWSVSGIDADCARCEEEGNMCGFDRARNRSFCRRRRGPDVKLIAGTSIGGFVVLLSVSLVLLYIFGKSGKEKETQLKVERFLATYKSTKPTRYTYSEIKKITKSFKHKLGQGGFGSVYEGELPNGIPVAVKMLEKSKGEGEEFINEVATIGRIHHVNIVRLLGFCSEGMRHALIYEFLENGSLEKVIFSNEAKRNNQPLNMEKVQDIAIGIARGIEYLHQGCDQRILHFDIKPHNILLDNNFNPKISDFGLAKLCSRDNSIVSMTAARGTMGYIAPEMYSRNFGTVSHKSDVYSFGMLLLEMVTGRKNVDPAIENQVEVYLPEWVYERLVHEEDLGLALVKGEGEEIVKKLIIVALWCIQWNPEERPSMSRVVQLLMLNLESMQIPPKPFVSSSDSISTSGV